MPKTVYTEIFELKTQIETPEVSMAHSQNKYRESMMNVTRADPILAHKIVLVSHVQTINIMI